ncbi:MAG TPA: glycoside hydrolase family 66 protein, partial [Meiothermus sp.]|nr:glycoside hydrolase family 66 protein [Meiothermus sp.]
MAVTLELSPDRALYRPGETVTLRLEASGFPPGARAHLRIYHLAQRVFEATLPLGDFVSEFRWTPPPEPAGYGVEVNLTDASGLTLDSASTAFDVHRSWLEMPRYGFLSDFSPGEADPEQMDTLLKHHVNALQFYDWMYRHDRHLPPDPEFTDPLGRRLSLATVRQRIEQAHQRGMAAMPYTTIYAGSSGYYAHHPEQALYKSQGVPWTLGEDFLYIFDPSAGSAWREHILGEYRSILEGLPFDGLHIDQYGDPKTALDHSGQAVDLAAVIPGFLQEAKEIAGPERAVIFNLVNDWPAENVAPSRVDAVYIEVWPPHEDYAALRDIVYRAKELSSDRPVILAAYLTPKAEAAYRLLASVIAACGATHIELGEGVGLLADPYFPKYERPGPELAAWMRRYYDFITRYQEYLFGLEPARLPEGTRLEGAPFTPGSFPANKVWLLSSKKPGLEVVHLINLTASPLPLWRIAKDPPPTL